MSQWYPECPNGVPSVTTTDGRSCSKSSKHCTQANLKWFFIWSDSPKGYFRWYLVGWVFVQDLPVCGIHMDLFLGKTLYLVFRYVFTLDPPARRKTDGFVSKCVGLAINHPQCNKVNPPQQSRDAGFPLIKLSTKNLIFGLKNCGGILFSNVVPANIARLSITLFSIENQPKFKGVAAWQLFWNWVN